MNKLNESTIQETLNLTIFSLALLTAFLTKPFIPFIDKIFYKFSVV